MTMNRHRVRRSVRLFLISTTIVMAPLCHPAPQWALVVHGGAGVIERKDLTDAQDKAYRQAMQSAAQQGQMAWAFNTSGMYRARVADGVPLSVSIFDDEP